MKNKFDWHCVYMVHGRGGDRMGKYDRHVPLIRIEVIRVNDVAE